MCSHRGHRRSIFASTITRSTVMPASSDCVASAPRRSNGPDHAAASVGALVPGCRFLPSMWRPRPCNRPTRPRRFARRTASSAHPSPSAAGPDRCRRSAVIANGASRTRQPCPASRRLNVARGTSATPAGFLARHTSVEAAGRLRRSRPTAASTRNLTSPGRCRRLSRRAPAAGCSSTCSLPSTDG